MPTVGAGYPSILDVNNAIRQAINDTQAGVGPEGSGRIYVDTWTPSITILNLAIQHLARDLENFGVPTKREVTFIINQLTPVAAVDPSIQVYLSFGGYWNGTTLNTGVTLPLDLLIPLKIGQRTSGSALPFSSVPNAPDGLLTSYQGGSLGSWAWQGDKIYFNGSVNAMDIELTYTGGVPRYPTSLDPTTFGTVLIPILDSL
jgi:hypothetical protein